MPQAYNRAFFKINKAIFTQAMKPPPIQANVNPIAPPVNGDVPHVTGTGTTGNVLNCTMGNWTGSPTSYTYQWKRDGATNVGTNSNNYTVVAGDVGHSLTCTVTATNSLGTTTAPPSNSVAVASLAARDDRPSQARGIR